MTVVHQHSFQGLWLLGCKAQCIIHNIQWGYQPKMYRDPMRIRPGFKELTEYAIGTVSSQFVI